MAAAIPAFSALYRDATAWENPNPDYATLAATYGHSATSANSPTTRSGIVSMAARAP